MNDTHWMLKRLLCTLKVTGRLSTVSPKYLPEHKKDSLYIKKKSTFEVQYCSFECSDGFGIT